MRNIPIDDGYDKAAKDYESFMSRIEKFRKDSEAGEAEERRIAAQKEKEAAQTLIRGTLVVKYGLPLDSDVCDVLNHLLEKNKLLRLAHAMKETRKDWTEGPYRVENALFTPTNDLETAIVDNVSSYLENFEDGRVFRDCRWNYDEIYAQVVQDDPDLAADYMKICELIPD